MGRKTIVEVHPSLKCFQSLGVLFAHNKALDLSNLAKDMKIDSNVRNESFCGVYLLTITQH